MPQNHLQRRMHADRRAAGARARMHERRRRWAEAERVRAGWTPEEIEAEEARLRAEIATFLAKPDATSPPQNAP